MHISSPCRLLAQPGHIGTHRPIRSISLLQHPRDHHTDDHCTSLRLGCVSKCLKDGDDLGWSILNYLLPSMYTFDHFGIFLKHLVAISSPLPQKSIVNPSQNQAISPRHGKPDLRKGWRRTSSPSQRWKAHLSTWSILVLTCRRKWMAIQGSHKIRGFTWFKNQKLPQWAWCIGSIHGSTVNNWGQFMHLNQWFSNGHIML